MDLCRLITFIDEECGNLKVVLDGEYLTRNNNKKKKSEVSQAYRYPLCNECYQWDWGNYDFCCGYIFCG